MRGVGRVQGRGGGCGGGEGGRRDVQRRAGGGGGEDSQFGRKAVKKMEEGDVQKLSFPLAGQKRGELSL